MDNPYQPTPLFPASTPERTFDQRAQECRRAIGLANDALSRALDGLAVERAESCNWHYVEGQMRRAFEQCLADLAAAKTIDDDENEPEPSTADLIDLPSTPGTITLPKMLPNLGGEQ